MEKNNTDGRTNGLGESFRTIRQKVRRSSFWARAIKVFAYLNSEELLQFLEKFDEKFSIFKGYKPIKIGIVIPQSPPRDRRRLIEEADLICDSDFILEIIDRCNNQSVQRQVLREDRLILPSRKNPQYEEVPLSKYTEDIFTELGIFETSADVITERVLELHKDISYSTLVGRLYDFSVYLYKKGGKVHVNAKKIRGWYGGVNIIH